MALTATPSPGSWADEIAAVAREYFNCRIDVMMPGTKGAFDPVLDEHTGGTPPTVILSDRAARGQHIRLPMEQGSADTWNTQRRYRFQIDLLESDPAIPKGAYLVVRGGRDPILANYRPQVISASNSSHAALRTIETIVEYGVAANG